MDSIKFDIDKHIDGERYVVVVNTTGEPDEWEGLTDPFDNYDDAVKWISKIKNVFGVYVDTPF